MTDAALREHLFGVLVDCLGDTGLAAGEGFDAQPGQRDYAQRWAETLARGIEQSSNDLRPNLLMLGADTGTGKTIGYALPALTLATQGKRIAIATNSHMLQRQMLGTGDNPGDLFRVAQWLTTLGLPAIKIARRVGRQAFISAAAVASVIEDLQTDPDKGIAAVDIAALQSLLAWAKEANEGRNSGLIEDAIEHFGGTLPSNISAAEISLNSEAPTLDAASYEAHLDAADVADVVVMTHHYLASCAMYRKGKLSKRGFHAIIIDEADKLTDAAASSMRFTLSLRRLDLTLQQIKGPIAERAKEALTHASKIISGSPFGKSANAIAMSMMGDKPRKKLETTLLELSDALKGLSKKRGMNPAVAGELRDASELVKRVSTTTQGGLFAAAISISPTRRFPSMAVMPTSVGMLLSKLWRKHEEEDLPELDMEEETERPQRLSAVLFTSATLANPGAATLETNRFKTAAGDLFVPLTSNKWAVVDTSLWQQFEPVKFGALKFILADPSLPSPVAGADEDNSAILNADWLDYLAKMILAAHSAGGRTLVLTRSYRETNTIAALLTCLEGDLIEQVKGKGMKECVEAFIANKKAVWISPTAWEGLNLPGMVNNLVVARLPLNPGHEIDKAILTGQGRLSEKAVASVMQGMAMNKAKRLFKQGIGRAIRKKTDKARIWIADPRFPISPKSSLGTSSDELEFSRIRTYPAFHFTIPSRFGTALERASVLLKSGKVLQR